MKTKSAQVKRNELLEFHHEVRTPLNAILGFVQILVSDKSLSKSDKQKYLGILDSKSFELMGNIDRILKIKTDS